MSLSVLPLIYDRHVSFTYQDFNASLGNLGWDLQSLEERCLLWTQGSRLLGHNDVHGGISSGTGRGFHLRTQKYMIKILHNCVPTALFYSLFYHFQLFCNEIFSL